MTTDQSKQGVRFADVSADEAGQRIDNYLLRELRGVPRSYVYRVLRRGEVRVNGGRVRAHYRVQAGDRIRIPPVREAAPRGDQGAAGRVAPLPVLYEDERLLVIDKPAGLAVHGGSGISHGVIEALRAARPDAPYLELVHRLDRDTSGCLLIAKRRSELRTLHALLREGGVSKRYLLLVRGHLQGRSRRVQMALRKNQLAGGERLVRASDAGKASETRFRLVGTLPGASLLEAEPVTGRTHQIRVHAAEIGHPLAGDEKYGDPGFNARMRGLGLHRLFLHAHSIAFSDPAGGRDIHVTAPLADELREVLDRLETGAGARH